MTDLLPLSAPEHLSTAGIRGWSMLCALPEGWLQPSDYQICLRYCELLDLRAALMAQMAEDDLTTSSTRRTKMIHPALRELRFVNTELLSIERQLALTPVSRMRFGLDQLRAKAQKSDLDKFLEEMEDDG